MRRFGYTHSGKAIIDTEALVIADCVRRLLAGESLPSLVAELNHRGVRTSSGGEWSRSSLTRLLTNPRIAGAEGTPPIITEEDHIQVVAAIEAQAGKDHGYGNQLKHLLIGFLVCGGTMKDGSPCGSFLWSQPSNTGRPGYACRGSKPVNGCGRIRIQAEKLEEHIVDKALNQLARDPLRRRLEERLQALAGDDRAVEQALTALDERLEKAAREYARGELSMGTLRAIELQIKEDRDRLVDYQRSLGLLRELEGHVVTLASLQDWWEGSPLLRRRELLRMMLEKVVVHPAPRRGYMHLDTRRLEVRWR